LASSLIYVSGDLVISFFSGFLYLDISNSVLGSFFGFGKFKKFSWKKSPLLNLGNSYVFGLVGLNDLRYLRRFEKYLGFSLLIGSLIFILFELRLKLKLLYVMGDIGVNTF
jgi:hypothetical protein